MLDAEPDLPLRDRLYPMVPNVVHFFCGKRHYRLVTLVDFAPRVVVLQWTDRVRLSWESCWRRVLVRRYVRAAKG